MKIREILGLEKTGNQYDTAIRACYLLFYIIGFIVFIAVGLQYMTLTAWLLGLFGAAFGATVYGTIVRMIINMVRKDRTKSRADILIQLFYVVFFAIATVVFLALGMQYHNAKTWIIALVGSYGGAFVYSLIARLIITLVRKDKRRIDMRNPNPQGGGRQQPSPPNAPQGQQQQPYPQNFNQERQPPYRQNPQQNWQQQYQSNPQQQQNWQQSWTQPPSGQSASWEQTPPPSQPNPQPQQDWQGRYQQQASQNSWYASAPGAAYHPVDVKQNKAPFILAYIMPLLFWLPLVATAPDSSYGRFHANQALILLLAYVAAGFALGLLNLIPFFLFPLIAWTVSTALLVFMIFGIVAASHGEIRELPLIGKLRLIR